MRMEGMWDAGGLQGFFSGLVAHVAVSTCPHCPHQDLADLWAVILWHQLNDTSTEKKQKHVLGRNILLQQSAWPAVRPPPTPPPPEASPKTGTGGSMMG